MLPIIFNLSLNFAIRRWWSKPHSVPSFVFVDCIEHLHLQFILIHGPNSRFLHNIVLYSIRLYFQHQIHPQLSTVSALVQPFHSFRSYLYLPSTLPEYHIEHILTLGARLGVISFCLIILHGFLTDKNTRVVCHSLLWWTMFCQNSPLWPICLRWPCMACLIPSLITQAPSPQEGSDPWELWNN